VTFEPQGISHLALGVELDLLAEDRLELAGSSSGSASVYIIKSYLGASEIIRRVCERGRERKLIEAERESGRKCKRKRK
jgi:hypothetical protein